jgi:hypothetical protein
MRQYLKDKITLVGCGISQKIRRPPLLRNAGLHRNLSLGLVTNFDE